MSYTEPVPAPDPHAAKDNSGDPGKNGSRDAQIFEPDAGFPQPPAKNGVDEDMATVALDSALLKGAQIAPALGRECGNRRRANTATRADQESHFPIQGT